MEIRLTPYLMFAGRCQEALDFYATRLGAVVEMTMRFDESPEPTPAGRLAPGFETKIMHAAFRIAGCLVYASDGCDAHGTFQNFQLALTVPTEADADRMYDALADGGTAVMPLARTFWSPRYGMVKDRFGVPWMVMVPGTDPQ